VFRISSRNRFTYAKTYALFTAPLAVIFTLLELAFIALLVHGVVTPDGGHVLVGLFGTICGFFLARISIRNFRESLRDSQVSKAQRQK
jgi:hypothetical protein